MKKRLLALALCVCTIVSMSACSKKEDAKNSEGKIKLGEYSGYTIGTSVSEVTDEEVQEYLDTIVSQFATTDDVTEGTLKAEDKVKITYTETNEQTKEGEEAEGKTTVVSLTEDGFAVDGFVDGLIGKTVGETVEMDLTYPEDYSTADLAGKAVHYSVKIDAIRVTTIPEMNDEFVKTNFSYAGLNTADEYKELMKKEAYYISVNEQIWEDVLAAQTVESYPTEELKKYVDLSYQQIENMMTYYGYTMSTYLQMVEQTEDELMAELEEKCKNIVKEKMFVREVAKKEKIEYSEDAAVKYAAVSGFTSLDEFKEYLETYGEELEYTVLSYQVQNFISESAKVVSDEETTAGKEETETTTEAKTEEETTTAA